MSNRIKELRLEKGLSQRKLSEETGISQQSLSFYEKGDRKPKIETWQKLADYFGVSVGYLQGVSDIKNRDEILKIGKILEANKDNDNLFADISTTDLDYSDLSRIFKLDIDKIKNGNLTEEEWANLIFSIGILDRYNDDESSFRKYLKINQILLTDIEERWSLDVNSYWNELINYKVQSGTDDKKSELDILKKMDMLLINKKNLMIYGRYRAFDENERKKLEEIIDKINKLYDSVFSDTNFLYGEGEENAKEVFSYKEPTKKQDVPNWLYNENKSAKNLDDTHDKDKH